MNSRILQPDTHADVTLRELLDLPTPTNFVMVAGAGSGKTTSLVKALAYLERTRGNELRKRGQTVACITYTEVAVSEILKDIDHSSLFHVSTIHSFLWTVIRPFQSDIAILVQLKLERKIAEDEEKIVKPGTRQSTRERFAAEIEAHRRSLAGLRTVTTFRYGTGSNYSEGILGHSDIIDFGICLLDSKAQLRKIVAAKFPFVFVDESQDTKSEVYNALKRITSLDTSFCLGFFGDPMQKIYLDGIGRIERDSDWDFITKPENFRCPTAVLNVINNIRREEDGLFQTRGREILVQGQNVRFTGTARMFIFPADNNRDRHVATVRAWIAAQEVDPLWLPDNPASDVRVLVIVHRMAANRLGFGSLYSVFNDEAPEKVKEGFIDGTSWPLVPFLKYILPLVAASNDGNQLGVMQILRENCPLLRAGYVVSENFSDVLRIAKRAVDELVALFAENSDGSIGDVIRVLTDNRLMDCEDRYVENINTVMEENEPSEDSEWLSGFMRCKAVELWGYRKYITDLSPYCTQQGVKGAEFDRVLVILDDEEGRGHKLFSYNKLFGLTPPSKTDVDNQTSGRDTAESRSRRLFYVCCSRARQDLAVVLFADDVRAARDAVISKNIFHTGDVHVLG
jgi:DNA helicase-2/ATP-dependent DNA helicase PcrA